jgi:hypothetical protein
MQRSQLVLLAAGVLALAPRPLRADVPGYKVQTLARTGDTLGGQKTAASGYFEVGALNDAGQIAVDVQSANGAEMILQSSGGTFAPIAAPNQTVSGIKWPAGVIFYGAIQMNQAGDIAFATQSPANNSYHWDHPPGRRAWSPSPARRPRAT